MLIFSLKSVVDVDRKGKKVVINIMVDPPMYPPQISPNRTGWPDPLWGITDILMPLSAPTIDLH